MNIKMSHNDRFRVSTDQGDNFIDINGLEFEQGIAVDAYPWCHYIEMREKERQIRTFYFKNKRAKREMNLGWWDDAEVIFARNDVKHD